MPFRSYSFTLSFTARWDWKDWIISPGVSVLMGNSRTTSNVPSKLNLNFHVYFPRFRSLQGAQGMKPCLNDCQACFGCNQLLFVCPALNLVPWWMSLSSSSATALLFLLFRCAWIETRVKARVLSLYYYGMRLSFFGAMINGLFLRLAKCLVSRLALRHRTALSPDSFP